MEDTWKPACWLQVAVNCDARPSGPRLTDGVECVRAGTDRTVDPLVRDGEASSEASPDTVNGFGPTSGQIQTILGPSVNPMVRNPPWLPVGLKGMASLLDMALAANLDQGPAGRASGTRNGPIRTPDSWYIWGVWGGTPHGAHVEAGSGPFMARFSRELGHI